MSGRFLIVSWDGGGNNASTFRLGERLRGRGHRVTMLGWESMGAGARAAGLRLRTYPSVPPWPAGLAQDDDIGGLRAMLNGPGTVADILDAAAAERPDALLIDCMMGAAFVAAERLSLPTAVLVHVLYGPYARMWGGDWTELDLARHLARAERVLAFVPPGLDEPGELPPNTAYVGPVSSPDRRETRASRPPALSEPGDPWVLLTLSTLLQRQLEALPPILEALSSLPVRVLLTLGGAVPADAVHAPGNVTVVGFAPHELVLPHVAAVVCHGGLSTITAALAAGVPLVCIPQGRDQPLNAARVEACGAGRTARRESGSAAIADAVAAVVGDPEIRAAAQGFARATAALGHGERATGIVAGLLAPAGGAASLAV